MYRKDIEALMKKQKRRSIELVYNEHDPLGVYCFLQGGVLVDYTIHRVDRKKDVWGYLEWANGKAIRKKFEG